MISSNSLWVVDMSLSIVYSFNRIAINRVHMLRAYWNSARNLCRIQSQVKYLLFSSLKSSFFSSSCFFASSCLVTCQMNSPKLNSTAENILKHFTNNAVETKFTSYKIHFRFFFCFIPLQDIEPFTENRHIRFALHFPFGSKLEPFSRYMNGKNDHLIPFIRIGCKSSCDEVISNNVGSNFSFLISIVKCLKFLGTPKSSCMLR